MPGHGPLMRSEDLKAYVDDLADQAHLVHDPSRTAVEAARILIKEDRYTGLGLPQRLAIPLSVEYRHLDKAPATRICRS